MPTSVNELTKNVEAFERLVPLDHSRGIVLPKRGNKWILCIRSETGIILATGCPFDCRVEIILLRVKRR